MSSVGIFASIFLGVGAAFSRPICLSDPLHFILVGF